MDIKANPGQPLPSLQAFFFIMGLLGWAMVNLTQSALTEIGHDEAYYWMYSRYLDWGYFDHPPMIALWIWIGHTLWHGEIATRLITVIAQVVTLAIVWKLISDPQPDRQKRFLFFGLAASIVMFQMYGFIATPDAPLLLFTALFLLAWKKFLDEKSFWHTLFLGLSMAGLMYSKYHGLLIISFTVVSHLRILRQWTFWSAAGLGLLLFLPHLWWQYQHDFPTLQYHLFARSRPFHVRHVLNYFPNQLLTFNPFFLGAVAFVMIRIRPRNVFDRSLYMIVIGFLTFFLLMTFRGHVEPHWTIAAAIPMLILVYKEAVIHTGLRSYIYRFVLPSILLIVFVRIALIIDFLPVNTRFHGQKEWAIHLASIAGDTPVVFRNSYMRPSMYMYYGGYKAAAINSLYYRKTQYDLWPFEEELYGKKVILMTNVNDPASVRYEFPNGRTEYLHQTDHFFTVQKIKVEYEWPEPVFLQPGDSVTLSGTVHNPYPHPIPFNDPVFPVIWNTTFIKSGNDMTVTPFQVVPDIVSLAPGESKQVTLRFTVPDICPQRYKFGITLQAGIIQETFSSRLLDVTIVTE